MNNELQQRIEEQLKAENARLRVVNTELYTALAFAKSCILSGEKWSEACDQMIDGALRKARGEAAP